MKLSLFVLIFLFLLSGCVPKPTIEVKQKPLPAWIMNPPQSDLSTLYGVGEGKDKQEAISNALNEIISTLSVSVESKYNTTTKVSSVNGVENYSQDTQSHIKSKVKELRISNYDVLHYEKIGFNKYAVLVKSNKNAIFETLKDETDKTISLLKSQELSYKSSDVLKQLQFYKRASTDGDNLVYQSVIMKVLNKSFDDSYIIKEVSYFKNSFTTLQSKISFSISSDNASKNLAPVIKDVLSSKGFKIANLKNDYHLNINIVSKIMEASSYGFDLARSAIEITLEDNKKQILSTKKLNITGQSTQGYEIAKENIAYKLKELLSKDGIEVIIDTHL